MTDQPTAPEQDPGFDSSGVPTFDSVREKIEDRFQTAIGAGELDAATPEGQDAEQQYRQRRRAAAERLGEICESMRKDGD